MTWVLRITFAVVLGIWFSAFLHAQSLGGLLILCAFVVAWTWLGLWVIKEWE